MGPENGGGLEFFHLYDLQGYGQIECFLKYWRTPRSQSGTILRIVMSWIQYCAGVGWSVVGDTTTKLPHLESNWITSMRDYLATVNGSLELREPLIPQLQREQDSFIMDHVIAHGRFKPAQIKAINWCRLYLGVVTVSDIATAAGTHLIPAMCTGNTEAMPTRNTWLRVHQKKPNKRSWREWNKACNLLATPKHHVLHQRLGNWTVPAASMRHHWPTWKVPDQDILYIQNAEGSFNSHPKLTHDFDELPDQEGVPLPAAAMPVDVTRLSYTWKVGHNACTWALPTAPPPLSHNLLEFVQSLPRWEQDLLAGLELLVSQNEFFEHLTRASIIMASDGSVQGHRAAFGWIISTQNGTRLAECSGPVYGAKPNSYRAEGYGVLSALRLMCHLLEHWQIQNQFCLVCDNKSMVDRTNEEQGRGDATPNSTMDAEWDVLIEIWTARATLPKHHIEWIKGHQDKIKPYEKLSLKAQLNVDYDAIADAYIVENPNHQYQQVPLLPTSGIQLQLPIGTITNKLKRELRLARTADNLRKYLCGKFGWDEETFDTIDWEAFRRAMGGLDKHSITLRKHVNNCSPVGSRVHWYNPKYPRGCCSCGAPEEKADHLMHCPTRESWRRQVMSNLHKHFKEWDTPLDIQEILLEGTKAALENRDASTIQFQDSVADVFLTQESIGWTEMFRGRFSKAWRIHQEECLGARATKWVNGQTWLTALADLFLEQWLALWKERNGDRHGHDRQSQAEAAKRQAVREVELLYQHKDTIEPHLRWIYSTPMEQMKQKRTYVLRAWISNFGPVLKKSHEYQTRLETG